MFTLFEIVNGKKLHFVKIMDFIFVGVLDW